MKPIELQLKAFGQYLQEQTLRFDRLDQVFLISGETGAGKTTLFDAISYALYGKGLGARANASAGLPSGLRLRSQLARDDESTRVRFHFAVRGTEWLVERSPYQFVRRKRGGAAEFDKYVTLARVRGGEVLETIAPSEIEDKLARLIGLRHEDFSKILVLPQGEFQQFLAMTSDQRSVLLRTLFPVHRHSHIAAAAKEAVAAVKGQLKALESVIAELRSGFDDSDFSERERQMQEQLGALQQQELELTAAARLAGDQLQRGRALAEQHRALAEQQRRLQQHLGSAAGQAARQLELQEAQRAAAVLPALHEAQRLTGELHTVQEAWLASQADERRAVERLAALQPLLDALPHRRAALQQASVQLEQLGQRLGDLERLRRARAAAQEAAQRLAASKERSAHADAQLAQARAALQALDAVAERRAEQEPALRGADGQARQCKEAEPYATVVEGWQNRSVELRRQLDAETGKRDLLRARQADAAALLDAARERLRDNAALVVAAALRPGEPCMACGSRDHPQPHQGNPQDGDLLALEKAAAQALQSAQDAYAAQDKLVAQLQAGWQWQAQAAEQALQSLVDAGYRDAATWRTALAAHRQRYEQLRAADQALADQLAARPSLNKQAQSLEDLAKQAQRAADDQALLVATAQADVAALEQRLGAVDDLPAALTQAQRQLHAAQAELAEEQRALETLQAQGDGAATAVARCKALRESLDERRAHLQQRLPAAQEALQNSLAEQSFASTQAVVHAERSPAQLAELNRLILQWDGQRQSLQGAIDTLLAAIDGRAAPELAGLEHAAQQAALAAQQATEQRSAAAHLLQDQRQKFQHLCAKRAAYAAMQAESGGLLTLSQHLNGDIAPKIDFATWMLTWWLEQVLQQANRRMTALSDSRYAFALRTSVHDGRQRAGLDLDVIDTWSNQRRDVGSLSGGEKFLASLSLALGLADVVQSHNGGVQLDTLFIDEGFGSLDAATLDRAMDLINRIAEHRAVGLISHVEAMQRAIPSQIRVRKSPQGSRAEVVTAALS